MPTEIIPGGQLVTTTDAKGRTVQFIPDAGTAPVNQATLEARAVTALAALENPGASSTQRVQNLEATVAAMLRLDTGQLDSAPVVQGGADPPVAGRNIILQPSTATASVAATNLALNAFNAVSDPSYRQFADLRGMTKVRIMGRLGGAVVAATKIRIQYHLGVNPAVVTGDAGWTTLADSAGSHTLSTFFYSAELAVPAAARVNNVLIRPGIFSGDGVADPTLTACILNFYP